MTRQITEAIDQSLSKAGLMRPGEPRHDDASIIEGTAREVKASIEIPARARAANDAVVAAPTTSPQAERARPGTFATASFACAAGTRAYKVYLPACHADAGGAPMPLVVMLHGCTQSPEDFAAGTRMNALADQHGFVVVYPAQCQNANASKCWNWFRAEDQARDRGEPALVAGIAREVAANYRLDERRIFVAGMSAGAAMAVVLGATYPDLFAAVGAHSGLPYAVAHDVPSAFGAMQGRAGKAAAATPLVPTIVFHGDADTTVQASNGKTIVRQAVRAHPEASALRSEAQVGVAAGGTTYERTIWRDADDRIVAEHWALHGTAHAWSGGSAAGSYTDARGPDASAEMVRFFLSQGAIVPRDQRPRV
ncbi:MAG: PHB depolymerase family esterase [Burkholderiales bacterium]